LSQIIFKYFAIMPKKSIQKEIQEKVTCSICSFILVEPVYINTCQHTFCKSCIYNWYKKSNNCPLCRNKFQLYQIKPNSFFNDLIQIHIENNKRITKTHQHQCIKRQKIMEQHKKKEIDSFISLRDARINTPKEHNQLIFSSVWESVWSQRESDFVGSYLFLCEKKEKQNFLNQIKLNSNNIKNAKINELLNAVHNLKLHKVPCSIKRETNKSSNDLNVMVNIEELDLKNILKQYIEK